MRTCHRRDEGLRTVLLAALAFLVLMLAVGLISLVVSSLR